MIHGLWTIPNRKSLIVKLGARTLTLQTEALGLDALRGYQANHDKALIQTHFHSFKRVRMCV